MVKEPQPTQDKIIYADTEYSMVITLKNTVGDANEDITTEVEEETNMMIFYGWTNGFCPPAMAI